MTVSLPLKLAANDFSLDDRIFTIDELRLYLLTYVTLNLLSLSFAGC